MRKVFCEILEKELNLPDKCKRIISFSPAITESLFEMNLSDKVVGVSVYCVRPKEARNKIKVGSYSNVSIERIKSLNPDLIFTTTGYQREFAKKLSKKFPVYSIPLPITLSSLISSCIEAGYVSGYYDEARNLEKKLLKNLKISKINKELKVYVEIDLGGPVSFGAYSYITNTLNLLGVKTVFNNLPKEWIFPDFNKVKEEDPDVIIYEPKMFRPENKEKVIEKFKKRGWSNLNAIKNDAVLIVKGPYDFLAHHGPSFVYEVIPWLIKNLNKY